MTFLLKIWGLIKKVPDAMWWAVLAVTGGVVIFLKGREEQREDRRRRDLEAVLVEQQRVDAERRQRAEQQMEDFIQEELDIAAIEAKGERRIANIKLTDAEKDREAQEAHRRAIERLKR